MRCDQNRLADSALHRVRAVLGAICVINVCFAVHASSGETHEHFSPEIESNAQAIQISLDGVFSSSTEIPVIPAAFIANSTSQSTTEELHRRASHLMDEAALTHQLDPSKAREWETSTELLTGLSGEASSQLTLAGTLPRLIGMTLLILCTCAGSLWLAQRWMSRQGIKLRTAPSSRMSVKETLSVAAQCRLHIVQVDDQEFLAAINSQGLQQLVVLSPTFDELIHEFPSQAAA